MKARRRLRTSLSSSLAHQTLEKRLPLTANLAFAAPLPSLSVNEGDTLEIAFDFTDTLATTPGESIGLDPTAFAYPQESGSSGLLTDFGVDGSGSASDTAAAFVVDTGAQGGAAPTLSFGGQTYLGVTASADVGFGSYEVAVFRFNSFDLDFGQTITASGDRPLAILSLGDIAIGGVIDASANGAQAGPGGGDGGLVNGVLPTSGAVAAGGDLSNPRAGGAGRTSSIDVPGDFAGGGGGFGGAGGFYNFSTSLGGLANGDLSVGVQGGGGGGGGRDFVTSTAIRLYEGGGGGGGVELGALGAVTIEAGAQVLADGADGQSNSLSNTISGGGGAGGGILVHATDVAVAGTLSATGGTANTPSGLSRSGGGGGGRVLLVTSTTGTLDTTGATIDVSGGLSGTDPLSSLGTDGGSGVSATDTVEPATSQDEYVYTVERLDPVDGWVTWFGLEGVDVVDVQPDGMGGLTGSVSLAGLSDPLLLDDASIQARVTVADNQSTPNVVQSEFTVTVANVAPVLANVDTDSSTLYAESVTAGQTVTLAADFSDVGVLDTHTATIDWGDGTVTAATVDQLAGTITATHEYEQAGFYDVTVTLTDDDNGQDVQTTQTVIAGVGVQNGVLLGIGTSGDDVFKVFLHGGAYHVHSRLDGGDFTWESFSEPIGGVELLLGPGDDVGFISSRIAVDAYLDGGSGDDFLVGGSGDDIVLGGDGYDLMFGRFGRDLMIGGAGGDAIFGDGGEDVLIAGTTAHDTSRAALDAILAEWTSNRSYAERVDNLTGDHDLSLDGLNGEVYLIAEGEEQTVFDDESTDWLVGGRGKDLYFAGEDDISLATFWETVESIEAEAPSA